LHTVPLDAEATASGVREGEREVARSEDEDEFAAIVGRIGDDEDRRYRSRSLRSFTALLVGSALVVVWVVVWQSAWGAVVGLPLMAAADLVWIVTLRRARRWRRSN